MRMKPALTLDDAKKMLAAAEDEATRNNWGVVIAILNDGGRLVALHRMDRARPGNDDVAIGKARTSAMTCRPIALWQKWVDGEYPSRATMGFLTQQGAVPILIDGELVGAIGVSGVRSDQDEQVAVAAVKAVFPHALMMREGEEQDAHNF